MSEGVRLGRARNAGIQDRQSLLFMNYIHARLFKRSLLVLSVKVGSGFYPAFTLDTEARGLLPFYANLVPCTLLPSYVKRPSLLPYPHPMTYIPSYNLILYLRIIYRVSYLYRSDVLRYRIA